MKKGIQSFILLLICVTQACAQDLEILHRSFMGKYDQINTNREVRVESLTEGYLGALDRLKKQLQTTGQLDLVLQVQSEIESVRKDTWPLERLGEKANADLKALRTKFQDARDQADKDHANQLVGIVDRMEKLLSTQIVDLTKLGRIEDAKLAQKMKDDLANDEAIAEARITIKNKTSTVGIQDDWLNLWEKKEIWKVKEPKAWEDFAKNYPLPELGIKELKRAEVIYAHASSAFSYQVGKISQIRCKIALLASGDVNFFILADGKKVFEKNLLGKSESPVDVDVKFPPATNIEFITDSNGVINSDQAIWIRLQAK
jgi:hypothetical protein